MESLKDVIAKLKAQQNSQTSKPAEVPAKVEPVVPIEDEIDEDEEEMQEVPTQAEGKKPDVNEQVLIEIEMLQNNGRYRVELLHQLQEINRALVVIASCLADGKK